MQNCSSTYAALFMQHEQIEFVYIIHPVDCPIELNNSTIEILSCLYKSS